MKKKDDLAVEAQADLFAEREPGVLLSTMLGECDELFVKKLSLNDRDWSRLRNKHQAGVYVPPKERDGGFFPALVAKKRDDPAADEIREAFFGIDWPEVGETRQARLVHYTSKGPETHMTGLPKAAFCDLAPASLIVVGRCRGGVYKAITLDSQRDDHEILSDMLELPPDFVSGLFKLRAVEREREERALTFIEEVVKAYFDGTIAGLTAKYGSMPATADLAATARARFMEEHGLKNMDPFAMAKPGDVIRAISRGLEYEIFRERQMHGRAVELVRLVLGDDPGALTPEKALRSLIIEFPKIDATLLSAAQQRKSRAGYSFEHHIEAMLIDGGVPFEKQVVIEAKRRPDFILPGRALYAETGRTNKEALVLSAKTTLRERWKQVGQEMKDCDLFLATVDENIAANAIEDMASQGIVLVVPEGLKDSNTTEYKKQASVISFESFFKEEIGTVRWPLWIARGLVATRH
jgi:hypothetical protein